MDQGDIKSKNLGDMTSKALVEKGKQLLAETGGSIPATVKEQNLGHNAKKEALGPNTKR